MHAFSLIIVVKHAATINVCRSRWIIAPNPEVRYSYSPLHVSVKMAAAPGLKRDPIPLFKFLGSNPCDHGMECAPSQASPFSHSSCPVSDNENMFFHVFSSWLSLNQSMSFYYIWALFWCTLPCVVSSPGSPHPSHSWIVNNLWSFCLPKINAFLAIEMQNLYEKLVPHVITPVINK